MHAETQGYLIYRAETSGRQGECITPEPVAATEFVDEPGGLAFYRVKAVEHCGLESLSSNEVCSQPEAATSHQIYVEAETGSYAAPVVEVYDSYAVGRYAVELGKLRAGGPLTIPVHLPELRGPLTLWALTSGEPVDLSAQCAQGSFGAARIGGAFGYNWHRLPESVAVEGASVEIRLTTSGPGGIVDRILLSDDPEFKPRLAGSDLTYYTRAAVKELSAAAVGHYAVRLEWEPVTTPDFHHYNVYCGGPDSVEPFQEYLIASPSDPEYVDWGLKPGTEYHYFVEPVSRSGVKGRWASAVATTEPLPWRLFAEIERTWNTREVGEIELPFTMPGDGEFVAWGHVQSLDGVRSASVEMLLDGTPLATHRIAMDYICVGHGGPVLNTWLWDCMKPRRNAVDQPMAFAASAGEHVLTLRAPEGLEVLFDRFVVTNDLGYEPEGTVDFLVRPSPE